MKTFNKYLPIVIVCMLGFLFQACWKDKTIKDNGIDPLINLSPSYGIPLLNLTISGKDIVSRINKDSSSNSFYIKYDERENDLCVIVYDKTNLPVVLPSIFTSFDSTLTFPLNFFSDLRRGGWMPKKALVDFYVENSYTTTFNLSIEDLSYERRDGWFPITTDNLSNVNPVQAANTAGTPVRTLVKGDITVIEPTRIVFDGISSSIKFKVNNSPLSGSGRLNFNPEVKVPAHIVMDDYIRTDTTTLSLSEVARIIDSETISADELALYLLVENALPLDVKLQIYFADENYRIIDSIKTSDIFVKSGTPDPSSYLIKTVEITKENISMTKEKFKKIKDTKYLLIKETLSSYKSPSGADDIKLFKSNSIKIALSVRSDLVINGRISDIFNTVDTLK